MMMSRMFGALLAAVSKSGHHQYSNGVQVTSMVLGWARCSSRRQLMNVIQSCRKEGFASLV